MEASQVKLLANQLLGQHQLLDWHFQFDHARTRCGSCQYELKRISLSRHFAALNDRAEVKNVLLHEIAHALAGPGVGHGAAWRAQAVRIGARPETTAPEYIGMPSPKWSLVCRNCDKVVAQRHRRALDVTRTRCRQCGIHDGKLEWRRN